MNCVKKLLIAPPHMYELRSTTVTEFGYDQTNSVSYSFNNQGFRTEEFTDTAPIIILGNSISFGIGISFDKTFGALIKKEIKMPIYNLSWGAYEHTNHEQLEFYKQILKTITPKYVIWQINNLNRKRINHNICLDNENEYIVNSYYDFITQAHLVLGETPHTFIHWDDQFFDIDFSYCLIYNKYHVDRTSINNHNTFGPASHRLIAYKILKKLNEEL